MVRLPVRYVTGQTRVCVKRYRRLLAAASRTITSRSCLHVLPARVEARAVAFWRNSDRSAALMVRLGRLERLAR